MFRDRLKIRFYYNYANLSELINFYFLGNHLETIGFPMISRIQLVRQIRLILVLKFGDHLLVQSVILFQLHTEWLAFKVTFLSWNHVDAFFLFMV